MDLPIVTKLSGSSGNGFFSFFMIQLFCLLCKHFILSRQNIHVNQNSKGTKDYICSKRFLVTLTASPL